MSTILMRVTRIEMLNPLVRRFTLQSAQGSTLPPFDAGAHVRVRTGQPDEWRHYSLIDFSTSVQADPAPLTYTIAVRLDTEGRGGSRFMHGLDEGDEITIEPPRNDFPLAAHEGCAVLVAGGIGVTPLASMAARCLAQSRPVRMIYAGRSQSLMALLPELQTLLGNELRVHTDEEAGEPLNIAALLDECGPSDRLYVCGPQPMLDAVLAAAQARAWPSERVHFELFTAPVPQAGDHAFEVVLSQSGQSYTVPADQSILECLIDQGCDPMFDCKRGECGVCAVSVLEGDIDHRDYVLNASERAAGNVIQICISRAKGQRLVLDL
ncbi:PDR/VanB family oxidoreductase [Ottowia thiooxydans]|uniref:PDR/VanB family oxidoreductase n=1 Tax=Ottowia thiooxydans TaxID=219182 RepID=UPI0004252EB1|nr:PDR/VanB family oxidoreductase [Ottowia thiooxydans]